MPEATRQSFVSSAPTGGLNRRELVLRDVLAGDLEADEALAARFADHVRLRRQMAGALRAFEGTRRARPAGSTAIAPTILVQ